MNCGTPDWSALRRNHETQETHEMEDCFSACNCNAQAHHEVKNSFRAKCHTPSVFFLRASVSPR
jgi:hypothetical protein